MSNEDKPVQQPAAMAHNKHCGCPNCCEPAAVVGQEPVEIVYGPSKSVFWGGNTCTKEQEDAKPLLVLIRYDDFLRMQPKADTTDDWDREQQEYYNDTATVPAAGVQGDDDWTIDDVELAGKIMLLLGRAPSCSKEPGADSLRDRIAAMLSNHGATDQQPDGGRDAALEEAAAVCDAHESLYKGASVVSSAIRALADHPAPSSDAGPVADLIVHMNSVEAKIRPEYSTFDALKVGTYPVYLAAHPANGAQAGDAGRTIHKANLPEDERLSLTAAFAGSYGGREVEGCIMFDQVSDVADMLDAAILAAAKKGGA